MPQPLGLETAHAARLRKTPYSQPRGVGLRLGRAGAGHRSHHDRDLHGIGAGFDHLLHHGAEPELRPIFGPGGDRADHDAVGDLLYGRALHGRSRSGDLDRRDGVDPQDDRPRGLAAQNYGLFQDAGHATNWGNTIGTDTESGTGNGAVQTFTVFGNLPAGQFVAPGSYNDTITTTLTF
jgi:hypothetical protein